MKIDILTLFPEMFSPLESSMLGRAKEKNIIDVNITDIRDYTLDKHKRVDDYPFGGGVGMLMQVEPISRALESIHAEDKKIVYMSPKGKNLNQDKIEALALEENLVILCGHYEGIDERIMELWDVEEVSVGDYILTGGEVAALVLIDAVGRMIPGVLGDKASIHEESIYSGLLEYPQYTKPREYKGVEVPKVLLSGHHKNIGLWQFEKSLEITKERRPDLFEKYCERKHEQLSKEEKKILERYWKKL